MDLICLHIFAEVDISRPLSVIYDYFKRTFWKFIFDVISFKHVSSNADWNT